MKEKNPLNKRLGWKNVKRHLTKKSKNSSGGVLDF